MLKRHLNEEIVYRDRESQINAIEETSMQLGKPIHKHYSKPNVMLWRCFQYYQTSFCGDIHVLRSIRNKLVTMNLLELAIHVHWNNYALMKH
ncbi:RNA polymerase II-associated factor 1 [Schistosoma japonicum]|uniref:RNA polymerase II-associated factor 1 n=1 Tax=Schistosoma japonicum TaxID=6182 RepID=A0A4Z2CL21_SCHJA|nr:RNA polymerase II-associated factor 1 [Schistosoma japonicum]